MARQEEALRRSGDVLRGTHSVIGNYLCTVCGFCCMHHDGPTCEYGTWVRFDDSAVWEAFGHNLRCRLCKGIGRGFMLDMRRPRWSFDTGRYQGVQAENMLKSWPVMVYKERLERIGVRVHG